MSEGRPEDPAQRRRPRVRRELVIAALVLAVLAYLGDRLTQHGSGHHAPSPTPSRVHCTASPC